MCIRDSNRAVRDEAGRVQDIIAGPFFVCGLGEDDFCSLPKELQGKYLDMFKYPEKFTSCLLYTYRCV